MNVQKKTTTKPCKRSKNNNIEYHFHHRQFLHWISLTTVWFQTTCIVLSISLLDADASIANQAKQVTYIFLYSSSAAWKSSFEAGRIGGDVAEILCISQFTQAFVIKTNAKIIDLSIRLFGRETWLALCVLYVRANHASGLLYWTRWID